MKGFNKLFLTVVMGLNAASLFAANAPANQTTPAAKLVTKLVKGQGSIVQSFPAVNGLTGFVIQPTQGGSSGIVYADAKGQYLFAGSIVNSDGQDMTQMYTNEYIISKIAGPAYAAAGSTNYFVSGPDTAPHKAYVVIEPNCSMCHMLYGELKPLITSGQLQVRWIPVAFRNATSAGKAAAFLNAGANAPAALEQNEKDFNDPTEEGAITPLVEGASPAVNKAFAEIKQNNLFFMNPSFGFQGTPTILFKQNNGKFAIVPGYVQGNMFQNMMNSMGSSW